MSKQALKQSLKDKKGIRPANISREVFALMTEEDLAKINGEANPEIAQ